MCAMCAQCLWRPEEGTGCPEAGVTDGCELPCGEPASDSLQVQKVPLAAEPSLQTPETDLTVGWDWQIFTVTVPGHFCGLLRHSPLRPAAVPPQGHDAFTRLQMSPSTAGCLQTSCP